jgi:hypothetical protein
VASSRYVRGPALWIKRNVIRRYDGYIGPGPRSRELLTLMDPATAALPFLEFPNVIDKSVFGDGVAALRPEREALRSSLGLSGTTALWVCPAPRDVQGLHLLLPLSSCRSPPADLRRGPLRPTLKP